MKKQLFTVCFLAALAFSSSSCKKVYDDNSLAPLDQAYAPIPVTVTNASFFERFFVVLANAPTANDRGMFTITFSIPADKGKIKEITRVATGSSGLPQVQDPTAAKASLLFNWNGLTGTSSGAVPTPGNGSNTITYTGYLDNYNTYQTRVGTTFAPIPATVSSNAQAPNQLNFYFFITLEDGTTIVPPLVRVRVK